MVQEIGDQGRIAWAMEPVTGLGSCRGRPGQLAAPPAESDIGPEWDSPGFCPWRGPRGGMGKGSPRKGP